MNSKIRVDFDFYNQDPYIQLTLESGDLNDKALKRFVEEVSSRGVELVFYSDNPGNTIPVLRPMRSQEQESKIVEAFQQMCIESTSPDDSEALERIIGELRNNRRALKIETN